MGVALGPGLAAAQVMPPSPHENRCPDALRGVQLDASLVHGSVVFEFTSPRREQVKDVRVQLREAATVLQQLSRMKVDPHADPDDPQLPPLAIAVRDIDAGARVTIQALHQRDRAELRELARGFAEFWDHSDCAQASSISV